MDNEPQPQPQQPQSAVPPGQVTVPPMAMPDLTPSKQPKYLRMIIAGAVLLVIVVAATIVTLSMAHSAKNNNTPKASSSNSANSSSAQSNSQINSGAQQYARDTKRRTDMFTLQTQLEAFFQDQGYYPNLTDMNSASWRNVNMKSLDTGALVDPLSSCDPTTGCLVASPKPKAYAYAVTDSQGKSCESNDQRCTKYTLTATLEDTSSGSTFTKSNLD